jgi:hypothetical protein
MAPTATPDQVYRVVAGAVDPAFYRAVYPDLGALGRDAVRHYVRLGWREGRDPAPWFSTDAYLDVYLDVARAGINPLHHYLAVGRAQGREVTRSALAARYVGGFVAGPAEDWSFDLANLPPVGAMWGPGGGRATAQDRALAATAFDEAFYLSANPDVAAGGWDALDHFLSLGWREERDPSGDFSVADYLDANPDVAADGLNPFLHYLRLGRAEGRPARNALGFRHQILARLEPMEVRLAKAQAASDAVAVSDPAALAAALAVSRGGGLHLSFSHDDYAANVGGIQLCLQREAAELAGLGRDHLHLFPAEPWPMLRAAGERSALGVTWNGRFVGAFAPEAVVVNLAALAAGPRSFALHSLLGHAADEALQLLQAARARRGVFWLHDFSSLCAGYHLLRNDVADCGAPPPQSTACRVCVYGPHRERHVQAHRRLFEGLELVVASPSASALDLWRARSDYPAAAEVVLPHADLVEAGPALVRSGPLKIAFLGWGSTLKGWPIYRDLARRFAADRRYAFLHLGKHGRGGLPILFHEVAVGHATPQAMREAVARLGIDVAVIWPLCRETFSFTAYEAAAGGAAILTWPDSGNVAAFVEATGLGRVLPDEASLLRLFASGEALEMARAKRRPAAYDLAFGRMSAALIDEARA